MAALAALDNTGDTSSSESENEEGGGSGVEEEHIKEGENHLANLAGMKRVAYVVRAHACWLRW